MIDRLREQIQERLDQLAGEADRLRRALAALDPRSSKPPARKPPARKTVAVTATKSAASTTKRTAAKRTTKATARSAGRTAPGKTKASVLAALAGGDALTAGEVATKTGLARATVSTTLSKLAKSGEGTRPNAATGSHPPRHTREHRRTHSDRARVQLHPFGATLP